MNNGTDSDLGIREFQRKIEAIYYQKDSSRGVGG
jgi:hypothetical protein